jgi:hypothetical protein
MRGRQLMQLFEVAPGAGTFSIAWSSHTDVRGSFVVLTKSALLALSADDLSGLRARGNFLIADFVDAKVRPELIAYCHALLASSRRQYHYFLSLRACPAFHVTHHVDLRILRSTPVSATPRIAYFGSLLNAVSSRAIRRQVDFIEIRDSGDLAWAAMLTRYPVHYAVRREQPFDGFKPFLKGFVAAHVGAVVLTRDDDESRFHLGTDYPYYVASGAPRDVKAAIRLIDSTYGGPLWRLATARMRALAERTTTQVVIDEIELFLDFLGSQRR